MLSAGTKWVVTAKMACRGMAAGIAALALAGVAHASPIVTLFNTGVLANGTVEANGTVGDPHYILFSVPGGTTTLQARTSGAPIPPWILADGLSAWIGPNSGTALNGPPGDYDYRTTFDLTGFAANTASIIGKWAMDNSGVNILLNGVPTGNTVPDPAVTGNPYKAFSSFTITSGFISGLNTLDFIVNNATTTANPTGLRVELSGTATLAPEPASFLLFGAGLVGLSIIPRKRVQARKG